MDLRMMVSLQIIILMVQVDTPGVTAEFSPENGDITKCTATEFSRGRMAEFILEITSMTKNMVLGNSYGPMEKFTRANGEMVSNMVKDSFKHLMNVLCAEVNGVKAGELLGLMIKIKSNVTNHNMLFYQIKMESFLNCRPTLPKMKKSKIHQSMTI